MSEPAKVTAFCNFEGVPVSRVGGYQSAFVDNEVAIFSTRPDNLRARRHNKRGIYLVRIE